MQIRKLLKSKASIFCMLLALLLPLTAKSQISTKEQPISFRYSENTFRTNSEKTRTMPPIDLEALKIEDEIEEQLGVPPRFGYPHRVNLNLENSGEWFELPDGKLWKLEISCPKITEKKYFDNYVKNFYYI